jgi:hypothetical protein
MRRPNASMDGWATGMMARCSCRASLLCSAACCSVWASWSRVADSATSVQCCADTSWYAPRIQSRRPEASSTGSAMTLMCRTIPSLRWNRNAVESGLRWCRTVRRNRVMAAVSSGWQCSVSAASGTGPPAGSMP